MSQQNVESTIAHPRISVVVPVYNEEGALAELLSRVTAVLDPLPGGPHEIVFADDGSRDRSFPMLEQAAAKDPRIVVVGLSRNFGHQAALSAALDFASGDVIVPMDADLQDEPETITRFLEKYRQGFDVVYAVRVRRKEGWLMRTCYAGFYRLLSYLSNIELPVNSGDFCLMLRRVVDELKHTPERHRYLRGLRTWVGFPQTGIEVERAVRFSGHTKYTVRKLLQIAFDGIFAFSAAPLRAATLAGMLVSSLAVLLGLYFVWVKIFGGPGSDAPHGFTSTVLLMTFLAGVQLMFLGIIGEYVGRIYEEIKRRPHYIVRRVVGRPESPAVEYAQRNGISTPR